MKAARPHCYALNERGEPVPVEDLLSWARLFETDNRHVGLERIGRSEVSTVFLGIDHSFGEGPPVLWETMVFGGRLDGEQRRCSGSREQAEAMHQAMGACVRKKEWPRPQLKEIHCHAAAQITRFLDDQFYDLR